MALRMKPYKFEVRAGVIVVMVVIVETLNLDHQLMPGAGGKSRKFSLNTWNFSSDF